MAQKRRIVPQLINTTQATPTQGPSTALLSPPPAAAGPSPVAEKGTMTLKEQSEYAAKHLGPGRRIYVELTAGKYEVNWRKLLKERGALKAPVPRDPEEAGGEVPAKVFAKKSSAPSVFNSVIQKLEQQYMIDVSDESEEEEDEEDAEEIPIEGAEASDMEGPEAVGGFDDQYDMDDEFIDDTEFRDYYGGDRRKAKYTGFFINKGEIEKTGELVDVDRPSPPKKRRKGRADKAQDDGPAKRAKRLREQGAAGEGPKVKRVKKAAVGSKQDSTVQAATDAPSSVTATLATTETTAGDSTAREPPAHSAVPSTELIVQHSAANTAATQAYPAAAKSQPAAAEPAAAQPPAETSMQDTRQPAHDESGAAPGTDGSEGAEQDWSLPQAVPVPAAARKNGGVKGDDVALSKEVSGAVEKLREAASAAGPPKKDGHRAMPKQVNAVLPGFACAVMREADQDKAVLKNAVDAAMLFLEPFTSRPNLMVRIKTEWERARGGLAAADKVLKEEIAKRTLGLKEAASMEVEADDDFVTASPQLSQAGTFVDAGLEEILYSFISKRLLLEGGSLGPDSEILREAAAMFPAGTVSEEDLRKVYARKDASASRSPRNAQKERSPSGQPQSAADAPAAGSGAAATAAAVAKESPPDAAERDQQQRPQSGAAAGARPPPEQREGSSGQDAAGAEAPVRRSARASVDPATRPVSAMDDDEYRMWLQELHKMAADGGADFNALAEASVFFKRGTAKSIVHTVLMTAGKEGMTIPSVIIAANDMGLTGNTPWEMKESKKSHVSQIVNGEPAFAHVGKSQYALAAFDGVVNLPHKRKQKDTPSAQPPQAAQQPASSAQASEGIAPPVSTAQQSNGAHGSLAVSAPTLASQPQPWSEAAASAPAAIPLTSNASILATIGELQRTRNFPAIPPAVLGTLGKSGSLLQGLGPQAAATLLGVPGGVLAPALPPATTSSAAGGPPPASTAATGGSPGQTPQRAGSGGSQRTPQGSGGPKDYVRPLIGS